MFECILVYFGCSEWKYDNWGSIMIHRVHNIDMLNSDGCLAILFEIKYTITIERIICDLWHPPVSNSFFIIGYGVHPMQYCRTCSWLCWQITGSPTGAVLTTILSHMIPISNYGLITTWLLPIVGLKTEFNFELRRRHIPSCIFCILILLPH